MLRKLLITTLALAFAGLSNACSAPNGTVSLTLAANATTSPADGVSMVQLTANVEGAPSAVVSFEVLGAALLSATTAAATNGVATVSLYAPLEEQLATDGPTTATVKATVNLNGVLVSSQDVVITYTLPEGGVPTLLAYAAPDRVLAGGTDPIRVIVDGRRLTSNTVALSANGALQDLPTSLEMTDLGAGMSHGELTIPAAAMQPGVVTLTLRAEGAVPVDVELRFLEEGEAAFDLNGTFAEVAYGTVEIGNLIFLNPNPQCVIAPTFSLVTVEQTQNDDGTAQLTLHSQTCVVKMGDVNVHFVGTSTTHVDQGFIDATNAHAPPPLSFPLADIGPGASFDLAPELIATPFIIGADMSADPDAPLPTVETDARVEDQDFDGNPGVTLTNSTQGEQHVVYRTRLHALRGTIVGSNGINGETEAETETKIFGGDSPLAPTITAMPSPWFQRRVDGRNGSVNIAARDGDPSSISCDDLEAYIGELQIEATPPNPNSACN
jgi:hypothetical protein